MGGDLSSNQSVMGAYPNTQQNPWPGGYGQNPPAWTQPPQVQGQQQWNSGYAPQVKKSPKPIIVESGMDNIFDFLPFFIFLFS